MRAVLTFAISMCVLGAGAVRAAAETDLAVLPPVGVTADVGPVKTALAGAGVGTPVTRKIDSECASDPGCLTKVGAELGAHRVLAIEVNGTKVTLTLADASAKLLLATRDFDMPKKKLAKELGPTVKKFVDDATIDKAKALFAEGNENYNLGEFDKALERYKLAYRVKPLPAFQFNIAQCHRKLGQHQEAIAMYQAYLVGVPNAKDKATVESLIAESRKAIADKQALESQREHDRLATEQKKAEEARKAKEAEAAAQAESAKTEQARIAAERERDMQFNRHPARKWMILTSALGLGAVGAGAYFGTQAREVQQKFNDLRCPEYPQVSLVGTDIATCDDYRAKGKRDALLSNVLIGSGAAVVVTSLIILIADPGNVERPTQNRASVAVTPTSFQVVVKW